jgi:hypothetical protein
MKEKIDMQYVLDTRDLIDTLILRSKKIVRSNKIKETVKYDFKRILKFLQNNY